MRGSRPERRAARSRNWHDEFVIAGGLALLAASLAFGGWAWRLDRLAYDFGLALWSRPPPAGIVIVAIDDASIAAIGRWPWRRAVHASLLERLAAAEPRAIALDLVLSEPDPDPQQDALLAAAMRQAAPVVLPLPLRSTRAAGISALTPVPMLRDSALVGASEATVDSDGVLRHAFLHTVYGDRPGAPGSPLPHLPHLALALLQAGGEAPAPGLPVETAPDPQTIENDSDWRRTERFLIRYSGPPGHVRRVSYVDVLRGAVPVEALRGQYLLVGMTAQGLGDTLATPVNGRRESMPGIEVLANVLYTLRSGDTLFALPAAPTAAGAAVLLSMLVLGFGTVGARLALPAALASVPLALLTSLLALRAGLWCNPVPYALPALLAYPLWSWRRLERAVQGLDQEIARLGREPLLMGAAGAERRLTDSTAPHLVGRLAGGWVGADRIGDRLRTLQRAGALVRQAGRFLADTLAAMPTAMLVSDDEGRVELANARAAALFDMTGADELQGLDLVRLLGEFETVAPIDWRAAIAALADDGQLAVEVQAPGLQTGSPLQAARALVVHVLAVQLQEQRVLIVSVTDIEAVKAVERERESALAFVSHDLRSPASSIMLLAELNLNGGLQTERVELLHEVRRLAGRILQLSEAFVRGAPSRMAPNAEPAVADPDGMPPATPLAALVQEVLADLRPQALAAGVMLTPVTVDATATVRVDRNLVARALGNLMRNAIRHAPPGSAVEVDVTPVQAIDGPRLRMQVRDHGAGFTAAQISQLHAGADGAVVGHAQGFGLGLVFVQRVARLHGGALQVDTAPGGGARVRLELRV